jgi:hypothetical protein
MFPGFIPDIAHKQAPVAVDLIAELVIGGSAAEDGSL